MCGYRLKTTEMLHFKKEHRSFFLTGSSITLVKCVLSIITIVFVIYYLRLASLHV